MDNIDPSLSFSDPGRASRPEQNRGDRFVVAISNIASLLYPALMVVICVQVLLRNAGRGGVGPGNQAWMDDLQWWIYGVAVLIGIGYAVTTNSHVRVDIFFDSFDRLKKLRIDSFGLSWLFLPFIILSWDTTFHYAVSSVVADEGSDSPNGLHNLWILKVIMNAAFAFIAVATVAAFLRRMRQLGKNQWWQKLTWALPSVAFVLNLVIFYVLWWFTYATGPEDMNARAVSRAPIFGELEFWGQEMKYTVLMALVATAALIALTYVMRDKSLDNSTPPPPLAGGADDSLPSGSPTPGSTASESK
ncbi:MAG: TRAP transporter small permease subunit [Pseudomonadota bacterium]